MKKFWTVTGWGLSKKKKILQTKKINIHELGCPKQLNLSAQLKLHQLSKSKEITIIMTTFLCHYCTTYQRFGSCSETALLTVWVKPSDIFSKLNGSPFQRDSSHLQSLLQPLIFIFCDGFYVLDEPDCLKWKKRHAWEKKEKKILS